MGLEWRGRHLRWHVSQEFVVKKIRMNFHFFFNSTVNRWQRVNRRGDEERGKKSDFNRWGDCYRCNVTNSNEQLYGRQLFHTERRVCTGCIVKYIIKNVVIYVVILSVMKYQGEVKDVSSMRQLNAFVSNKWNDIVSCTFSQLRGDCFFSPHVHISVIGERQRDDIMYIESIVMMLKWKWIDYHRLICDRIKSMMCYDYLVE